MTNINSLPIPTTLPQTTHLSHSASTKAQWQDNAFSPRQLMPTTHIPEISEKNQYQKIGFWCVWHATCYQGFWYQFMVTNMTYSTFVPDNGTAFLVWVFSADFWYVCHWHKTYVSHWWHQKGHLVETLQWHGNGPTLHSRTSEQSSKVCTSMKNNFKHASLMTVMFKAWSLLTVNQRFMWFEIKIRQITWWQLWSLHTVLHSRLQLDIRNLSLGMRHLVNAYEVEAGTV